MDRLRPRSSGGLSQEDDRLLAEEFDGALLRRR